MAVNPNKQDVERLLSSLPATPDAYPQKIDFLQRRLLVVAADQALYRNASFLDDRILGPTTLGAWLPIERAIELSGRVNHERPLHFIFHSGHVGSTLLSRLLDETGSVLSLREPLTLRNVADAFDTLGKVESLIDPRDFAASLAMLLKFWSRGYENTQCVVVKATSSTSRIAAELLSRSSNSRAVLLNLQAEPYLAALLAGQNSPVDLKGHGANRIRRLQQRLQEPIGPLYALSLGELAAMSWLAETWTQMDLCKQFGERMLAIDFDRMLNDVSGTLTRVFNHFGLPSSKDIVTRIASGAQLSRYSKATEFEYSPSIRNQILNESRQRNKDEIARGLHWLQNLARVQKEVGDVMNSGSLQL